LTEADFRRILTEPHNSLTRQYQELLKADGVAVEFTEDGVAEIAHVAAEINERTENIGARRLYTVLERLLEEVSFRAPDPECRELRVDRAYVQMRLRDIVEDHDLSRYIL